MIEAAFDGASVGFIIGCVVVALYLPYISGCGVTKSHVSGHLPN